MIAPDPAVRDHNVGDPLGISELTTTSSRQGRAGGCYDEAATHQPSGMRKRQQVH